MHSKSRNSNDVQANMHIILKVKYINVLLNANSVLDVRFMGRAIFHVDRRNVPRREKNVEDEHYMLCNV